MTFDPNLEPGVADGSTTQPDARAFASELADELDDREALDNDYAQAREHMLDRAERTPDGHALHFDEIGVLRVAEELATQWAGKGYPNLPALLSAAYREWRRRNSDFAAVSRELFGKEKASISVDANGRRDDSKMRRVFAEIKARHDKFQHVREPHKTGTTAAARRITADFLAGRRAPRELP